MKFTQLTDRDVQHMLATIGVRHVGELFGDIPERFRLDRPLDLPAPLTELELLADLEGLADRNQACDRQVCFLGAGVYDHFVPTVVDALASQSEFVTAYTPYQAEASQGALQALYEYQTLICQLTGMDVSNSSLYEGASAVSEAVLMARSINGRGRVVLPMTVHPHIRETLQTYLRDLPMEIVICGMQDGRTNEDEFRCKIDADTTAVVIQTPNFFGCIEELDRLAEIARAAGALVIASVDPLSCGLLKRPGQLGADIVVGDGQVLGMPMSFGGPTLGFMACRDEFMRKLPGRLVGATTDLSGRRAYCLTLQTREQHIRRERATSNICTNQGLLAIRAAIYLSAVGPHGLARIARLCLEKAHYAAQAVAAVDGFRLRFASPFFKEFVVQSDRELPEVLEQCHRVGILAGVPLGPWYPELADCFMIACTEKRSKKEIDRLVSVLGRC
ncbi:MAG: aminomethyl-transferring glycine dehydrogenase subunit GcvPA [Phycisphaerae bacterium]